MKCNNCASSALFEYRITHALSQFYCEKHLPKFLEARKKAGTLTITRAHNDEQEAALSILRVSSPEPEPVPEPKPVRKRKPKNATNS